MIGGNSVSKIIARHSIAQLPDGADGIIPVHLYGRGDHQKRIISMGNPLHDPIKRLGLKIDSLAYDLLSLSLAITAADTFINRDFTADAWAREIVVDVEVVEKDLLVSLIPQLEAMLRFLSGDIWRFEFTKSSIAPPTPYSGNAYKLNRLGGSDSVCLFSGGMDSTTGVLDLIAEGRNPVLVSHAYVKDREIQDRVAQASFPANINRLVLNASPSASFTCEKDISMRTRSFNFFCFAVIAARAIQEIEQLGKVTLFIPENGYISLNPPLTPQRVGSHSTRTTHPYYIKMFQQFLDALGLDIILKNPYQFNTKGEMLRDCKNPVALRKILDQTISCSNWKRKNMQCGRCMPCIIRRASYRMAGIDDHSSYETTDLKAHYNSAGASSDVVSLCSAIRRMKGGDYSRWIRSTGSLPTGKERDNYILVAKNGLKEVEEYFIGLEIPV